MSSLLPDRRTFAWLNHHRRLSKDYEGQESSSEAMIYIVMIRLMLRRSIALLGDGHAVEPVGPFGAQVALHANGVEAAAHGQLRSPSLADRRDSWRVLTLDLLLH